MAPELVPLAAPVPLPSWFEWAKLIVPPIITGLVVLVGAYLTYLFANRGRKEDILYKERYKGFEAISNFAYQARDMTDMFRILLFITADESNPEFLLKFAKDRENEFFRVRAAKPNRNNVVLLSSKSASLFEELSTSIDALGILIVSIKQRFANQEAVDSEYVTDKVKDINQTLDTIMNKSNDLIDSSLIDVNLPKR